MLKSGQIMWRSLVFLMTTLALWAADDPWTKVQALKSGTELRILKRDAHQPVLAKMDELTAESLVVVVKNEQVAIPKDDIERIEARGAGTRVSKRSSTSREESPRRDAAAPKPGRDGGPSTSTSSSVEFGSKGDFETVYRRLAPVKK